MDLKEILEFVKEIDDLKSLKIKEGDFSIKIEKNTGSVVAEVPVVVAQTVAAPIAEVPVEAEPETEQAKFPNASSIKSPLVGIYHDLEDARKVKIGGEYKKGDVLCNVEAMKLMNEITMPEDGKIVWVACAEGDTIEFDQLIFKYE